MIFWMLSRTLFHTGSSWGSFLPRKASYHAHSATDCWARYAAPVAAPTASSTGTCRRDCAVAPRWKARVVCERRGGGGDVNNEMGKAWKERKEREDWKEEEEKRRREKMFQEEREHA